MPAHLFFTKPPNLVPPGCKWNGCQCDDSRCPHELTVVFWRFSNDIQGIYESPEYLHCPFPPLRASVQGEDIQRNSMIDIQIFLEGLDKSSMVIMDCDKLIFCNICS
jgi:hypothetical protein